MKLVAFAVVIATAVLVFARAWPTSWASNTSKDLSAFDTGKRQGSPAATPVTRWASPGGSPIRDSLGLQLQIEELNSRLDDLGRSEGSDTKLNEAEGLRLEHQDLLAQQRAQPEETRNAARRANEEEFRSANGTTAWGRQLENTFRSTLPSSAQLTSVSCRADICRVEVAHADSGRFIDEFELAPQFTNLSTVWFSVEPDKSGYLMFIRPARSSKLVER
jgi:hypothetical protein